MSDRPAASDAVDPGDLARQFAARMAPIAVMVALLMAVLPPITHWWASWSEMSAAADSAASRMAEAVQGVAARQPWLWRYNVPKVLQATEGYRTVESVGTVRIANCDGCSLMTSESLGLGTGRTGGPSAWAPIVVEGRLVAWVHVRMDARPAIGRTMEIGVVSVVLGLVVGLLLFLWPVGVVRRQADAMRDMIAQLRETKARLREANVDLQQRVAEAIAEARGLSERVISTQEEERTRLARELHDGLGQLVAALRIELQLVERESPEAVRLAEARDLCDLVLEELRRAVRDLEPLELETAPLSEVLHGTCERFELRTGVGTSYHHSGPEVEDARVAKCLLRVLQEALNNVRRHAQAEEVGVRTRVEDGLVEMVIRDDGIGFDADAVAGGLGLRSMRERVHYLGGQIAVRTAVGESTRVTVTFGSRRGVD